MASAPVLFLNELGSLTTLQNSKSGNSPHSYKTKQNNNKNRRIKNFHKKQIVRQITEDRVKRVILQLYEFETFHLSEMLGPLFKN